MAAAPEGAPAAAPGHRAARRDGARPDRPRPRAFRHRGRPAREPRLAHGRAGLQRHRPRQGHLPRGGEGRAPTRQARAGALRGRGVRGRPGPPGLPPRAEREARRGPEQRRPAPPRAGARRLRRAGPDPDGGPARGEEGPARPRPGVRAAPAARRLRRAPARGGGGRSAARRAAGGRGAARRERPVPRAAAAGGRAAPLPPRGCLLPPLRGRGQRRPRRAAHLRAGGDGAGRTGRDHRGQRPPRGGHRRRDRAAGAAARPRGARRCDRAAADRPGARRASLGARPPARGGALRARAERRPAAGAVPGGRLMRIAYLSTDPGVPYGGRKGASVHVSELVDALAAEGAEVLALVSGVARDAAPPAPGATVEALPVPHSAAGSRAAARVGIPHLVELNAPLVDEARRYRRLEEAEVAGRLEQEVLRGADLVLAVSRPLAIHAMDRGARRVEVFPNAVAIERYPMRSRPAPVKPVAVFTGRVRPWHGIEAVAAAWRLLGDAAPALVVAGDPGEARGVLEEVGAALLGPIPHRQVPAVLAEADIGLAPYAMDAPEYFSPLKLFEYMAAGLAVVAGELPATRRLVSDGQAVLVPRGDPEALAAAVAGLAADGPRRERMGGAARALVAGAHTWRHRARRVMEHVARQPEALVEAVR